ncbi:MAG: carboxypeptidase regulatory-like domain-containing protein [Edaphobacter sp.]|uniref:carboxypeptidase regulatory-like domain-containing protein n=1 Tax=Edaphobacter sp. TaxID=1934404 RepID=UPI0023913019|nr:carboxypeptidase regulatory-like domain-containing protein [Edaphobacter sp.]MDE1176334.1 carboxypeptidase regulatory-like domain-containing protein [Edaphobacter sp.]
MKLQRHFIRFILPVLLLGFSIASSAQQQSASLTGSITDTTGAVIPEATITVTDVEHGTKTTATTNERGEYVFPQLPPGDNYQIAVTKMGFKETVQKGVVLQVAQAAKIDLHISTGSTTDSITITSDPPQLETQTSSLGQVISGQTVQNLPLNGRSTFRLIALTPGVTFSQSAYGQFGDVAVNTTWDTNFTINGGRAQSNEILIDGVPSSAGFFDQITTLPTVDDTQEFKVESNNLSAEYGRYAGGAINVTTKGGTNQFHGSAYEFLRNSYFDANDWFNKRAGNPRAPFRMNQFGGVIGGPLSIPGLYDGKDRTFFFFSYQGTRRTKGATFIGTVPTAAQRAGDFSAIAATIYNPYTTDPATKVRTAFAGNKIDPSLLDPVAVKMAAYYPLPNTGGPLAIANNFLSNEPVRLSQDVYSLRIDQNVTQKYHMSGRYAYSRTPLTQPDYFHNVASSGTGAVGTTTFVNQSFSFNNLYQFSPTLLMNANYGFARWFQARQTRSYGFDNSLLGFPPSLVSAITIPMFPAVNITGYTGLANQSYLSNGNDTHAVLINLTKILSRQTLSVGVDGRLRRINFFNVNNSAGTYSFATAQTQGPVASSATGGNAFASFMLGFGNSGTIPVGSGVELQNFYGAVYVQDDIRLTNNFTVNLGLRYDGETGFTDRHNELNYFDPTIASPAANSSFPNLTGGLVFAAAGNSPRTVYTRQHNNVAPRAGFAFSPDASTSIRGGFGLSYAPLEVANNAVGFSPSLGYASSTAWNTSLDGGFTPQNLLRNPFPQGLVQPTGASLGAGTQLGQTLTVWNHNPSTPYSMQWNFDVQRQFPHSVLFDLGYSASRGVHLTSTFERNALDPKYLSLGTGLTTQVANPFQPFVGIGTLSNATVARRQLLLPYPQFLSVQEVNNPYGSSTYHSLQTKLVKRMSGGVSLLASYTWSKLISNVNAQNAPIGTTDNTGVQNYYDLRAERSVSELDQPHNLIVNTVYELPFGNGKYIFRNAGALTNKFIGGWKLTGIFTEQSGFPLTLSAAGTGAGTRPNFVAGQNPRISGDRSNQQRVLAYFNTSAFITPPAYTFGNVGRTYAGVRGPGVQNLDASIQKDTTFEKLQAELRLEMFNVTNTPHFAMPDMGRQSATFGVINSVLPSPPQRQMQVALKLSF